MVIALAHIEDGRTMSENPPGTPRPDDFPDRPPGYVPEGAYPFPPQPAMPGGYPAYHPMPPDPLVSPTFGGWWTRSFTLVRDLWRPMALVQLISVVSFVVIGLAFAFILGNRLADLSTTTEPTAAQWRYILAGVLILLPIITGAWLLSLVVDLATTQLLVQRVTGQPVSIGAALQTGLRRAPALIGWGLLGGLATLAGLVFCILPGIYIAAVLYILPVVVLLERGNAVTRCFELFHAKFGVAVSRIATIAGLALGFLIVEQAMTAVLAPGSSPFGGTDQSTYATAMSVALTAVFSIARGVVFAPMRLAAYADMRARHEQFSTAYLAAA